MSQGHCSVPARLNHPPDRGGLVHARCRLNAPEKAFEAKIDVALIAACQRWPRGQIKVAAHSAAPRLQNHRRAIQCP